MDQEIIKKVNEGLEVFGLSHLNVSTVYNFGEKATRWCIVDTRFGGGTVICEKDDLSELLYFLSEYICYEYNSKLSGISKAIKNTNDLSMIKTIVRGYAVLAETQRDFPDDEDA